MQLMTVRRQGKAAKWYIDGKRVTQAAYDQSRTGKTLDTFQTVTDSEGTVRHYVQAREQR